MQTWTYCFFLLDYLGREQWWANLHCLPLCRKKGQSQIYELVRSGIRGMEVRLGQLKIHNWERQGGNDGSKRWCGSLSSSSKFFHHPFSFGHWIITREDKDGKNGLFEEEEEEEEEPPNTLLTLSSSDMYSSASIPQRRTNLRKGSWFNSGRCCNLLFPQN